MIPDLNRREALATIGAVGASALAGGFKEAKAVGVELGPYVKRPGVTGRMTGAQATAAALACEGVRCVFGVPGAQNNEFWDAMKARQVPYLLVANEASASVMADASARATGDVGVFCVVPGPGLTNAMTGIGEALLDSVPIVAILTDIDRSPGAKIGQVHSLPCAELVRPIVKHVFEIRHQAEIAGAIHLAYQIAREGEPGPVAIVIPFMLLTRVWDFDEGIPPPRPLPFDETAYSKAFGFLSNRNCRVGIYAGVGCSGASRSLIEVAEILQSPVATSVSGKGVMPERHPLAVGWGYGRQGTRTAEKVFRDVDILLAVGVKFSEVSTANYAIPDHDILIHVDANPDNLGKNVHTNVKVHSDSRLFLDRLVSDAVALQRPHSPSLIKKIAAYREIDQTENGRIRIENAVDPMYFFTQLRSALGPDELIFVDVTASTHWASEAMTMNGPRRYFTPADNQSMGWAIPAAIGAQKVRPDRMVVSITGDGCFLMSAIEMSTAARAGLPVKFFVLDDGTYHYMQMLQKPIYRRTTATEIANIDYAAFAQAVGLTYNQITCNAEIQAGVQRGFCIPGPVLTHVLVSYEGREIRWLNALRSTYLKNLPYDQKVRMASRVGVRTIKGRHPDDD